MKKIILTLTILITIFITTTTTQAEQPKEFFIVDTYVTESNSTVIEFNDKSYAIINQLENKFLFSPYECYEYEIKADNQAQLLDIIKTYLSNKYNLSELEIYHHSIFKDINLVSFYTQENYQNYLEFKNNFIVNEGAEVWELANTEAGIKNELESFIHFIKYNL